MKMITVEKYKIVANNTLNLKSEKNVLHEIHGIGARLANARSLGSALMICSAIPNIIGAVLSGDSGRMQDAKGVASKAKTSW